MGQRKRKPSLQALRVLHYLFQNPGKSPCGADLMRELGIASGTLYPILLRLEKNEFVESKWETEDPSNLGRPRRRLYKITGAGTRAAQKAVAEFNYVATQPEVAYEG